LRFRIESIDKENRDRIAQKLTEYLEQLPKVEDYYFADHGKKVESLDEGYKGEKEDYGRLWLYQKKIWESSCEMTVEAIKEKWSDGTNTPSLEYQLTRLYHILSNQLLPRYEQLYCFQINNRVECLTVYQIILISFLFGFFLDYFFKIFQIFIKKYVFN
jgi:hypothetical protein